MLVSEMFVFGRPLFEQLVEPKQPLRSEIKDGGYETHHVTHKRANE